MRSSPVECAWWGGGERGTRREDREIHENGSRRPDSPRSSEALTISLDLRRGPIIPSSHWSAPVSRFPRPRGSLSRDLARPHGSAPLLSRHSCGHPHSPRTHTHIHATPCPSLLPAPPRAPVRPASAPFRSASTWVHGRSSENISRDGKNAGASLFTGFTSLVSLARDIPALWSYVVDFIFRSGVCSRYNNTRGFTAERPLRVPGIIGALVCSTIHGDLGGMES